MNQNSRLPLSPHLQIYKLPLTAVLSILHRATGVVLAFGALLLVWILALAANSSDSYSQLYPHLGSWYGQIFLLGLLFSLYLHFCNGIRHLFWDIGMGFELATVDKTAIFAIVIAAGLTIATWVVAASMGSM